MLADRSTINVHEFSRPASRRKSSGSLVAWPRFDCPRSSIPNLLGLIIHPDMFVRDPGSRAAKLFQKPVNILDKDPVLQDMPGNFHERAVAGEEDRVIPERRGDIEILPAYAASPESATA